MITATAPDLRTVEIGRNGTSVKERLQVEDAGKRFFTGADPGSTRIESFPGITFVAHSPGGGSDPLDYQSVGSFYNASGQKISGVNLCSFTVPNELGNGLQHHVSKVGFYSNTYTNSEFSLLNYKSNKSLTDEQWQKLAFHLGSLPGWEISSKGEPEMSREKIASFTNRRLEITPEFYFDERKKSLFIRANNAVGVIAPSGGPEKFTFTYIGDDRTFDGKTLAKYPGLSDLIRSRESAPDAVTAAREGEQLKVISGEGKLLCSERVTAHKLVEDEIYFTRIGNSTIYSAPVSELRGVSTKFLKTPARVEGEIRALEVDPRRNFIVAAVARGNSVSLEVIDRASGEVCHKIENASEKFSVTKIGDIPYIDSSGCPRLAQTNFLDFKEGEPNELRAARLRELGEVNSRLDDLDALITTRRTPENGDYVTESGLEKNARNRLVGYFGPKIEKAATIAELTKIEENIEQLKTQPEFSRHLNLFEVVDTAVQKKKDVVRISGFDESLEKLNNALPEYDTPLEGVRLRREFSKLEEERRQLLVMDSDIRAELDGRLAELRNQVQRQIGTIGSALIQEIGDQFKAIQKMLKEVGSAPEVLLVASSQRAADFRELLELFESPKERELWEEKYDSAVQGRRNEILLAQETHKASLRAQSTQQIEECKELLGEIEEVFQEAKARGQLEMLSDTNPLVRRLRERADDLPEREGRLFTERITEIMQARREALAAPAPVQDPAVAKEDRVTTFLNESFPVFAAPDLVWRPEVIPVSPDADHGTLVFWSNFGAEYKPKIASVPIDLKDPETVKAITDHEAKASKFFSAQKRQVPQVKSSWVITEYHKQYLDDIAYLCKQQVEHQRHLVILEGESGTGKNILWSVFANATNRELFRFPCNAQMEKEDLTATKQYSQEKGTHKLLSELVRKIQTPGMIVFFDEFNALPTGTAKILNSLFDEDRSIIVDGKVYKAHPTVILAGAMNPKGYAGTKSLSTEVKGRARFLSIEYPPEKTKDGKSFTSYEAEMLAKQLPEFKTLTGAEFRSLWDFVINNDKLSGGDAFLNPERDKAIKNLRQIVQTGTKLREAYSKYQLRETSDIVNVPFSIREAVDVAACMHSPRFATVKDAIKHVFVPKGEDALEKANIEKVILSS